MMIALEDGIVQPADSFNVPGTRDYYFENGTKRIMRDHGHKNPVTVAEILQMSLNVGTSNIINGHYKHNPEAFIKRLRALGFGISLDFGIGNSARGMLKTPPSMPIEAANKIAAPWDKNATFPWLSIGYECQIPPIYILMFYNAIANHGVMIKPWFVEKIGQQALQPDTINSKICSDATLQKLIPMMEMVVEQAGGTANRSARTSMFKSAGKTGTSEVNNYIKLKDGSKAIIQSNQATFCGFFPAGKPVYSCIVVLRRKGAANEIYGAACGPVFREIAENAYLHNKRNNPASLADAPAQYKPVMKNDKFEKLSDVVGMGLSHAVYFLEKAGYTVSLNGNNNIGTVREFTQNGKNVELVLK